MRAIRRLLAVLAAVAISGACSSPATTADAANGQDQAPAVTEQTMRIRITTTDQVFTAVLDDSETARDFASLLPIEVTLDDFFKLKDLETGTYDNIQNPARIDFMDLMEGALEARELASAKGQ